MGADTVQAKSMLLILPMRSIRLVSVEKPWPPSQISPVWRYALEQPALGTRGPLFSRVVAICTMDLRYVGAENLRVQSFMSEMHSTICLFAVAHIHLLHEY
ncbi:hypothetical protein AX17_001065 [Amanita inopinata Kibby_2008]|nr:hypothetical protein AX17_001065 [Amanita inopinata Kibby_2008]